MKRGEGGSVLKKEKQTRSSLARTNLKSGVKRGTTFMPSQRGKGKKKKKHLRTEHEKRKTECQTPRKVETNQAGGGTCLREGSTKTWYSP